MTTTVQFRMDPKIKKRAQKLYADLGLDMSAAWNLFVEQSLKEDGLPFKPSRNPREIRKEWDEEVAWVMKNRKYYKSAEEAHADILKNG